jgi:ribosomal protein L7/L12
VPTFNEQMDRLEAVERKITQLYAHLGLAEPAPVPWQRDAGPVPPAEGGTVHMDGRVLDAVQEGNIIEAIKIQRETTGAGLAEAKAAIDEIVAQRKALGL